MIFMNFFHVFLIFFIVLSVRFNNDNNNYKLFCLQTDKAFPMGMKLHNHMCLACNGRGGEPNRRTGDQAHYSVVEENLYK